MRTVCAALIATALTSCRGELPADAISAVVDHIAKDQPRFCLASDGADPQDALVLHIKSRHPQVFVASSCRKSGDMLYQTPDGRKAQLIDIHYWRRTSPWHAKVNVLYDSNFIFDSGISTLSLRRSEGKWLVTDESVSSIS
jgi:hypothetical protein